jgi:hypothetical protein
MYVLIEDELFEVDEADVEVEGDGFWLAFEGEDEESFHEFCDVDPDEFE